MTHTFSKKCHKTTDYEVRGWSSGYSCAFFLFAEDNAGPPGRSATLASVPMFVGELRGNYLNGHSGQTI